MNKDEVWFKKSRLLNPLIAFYFFVAFIEIIAEYNRDYFFISYTKPLAIPLLMSIYWIAAKIKNKYYLVALVLAFIANLFLISESMSSVISGSMFLFLSQMIFIYIVIQKIKYPGSSLMLIGSLPYACVCFLVAVLIYDKLGLEFYLFMIQSLLITFFGGLSLANYFTKYNKVNSQLFTCSFLLSIAQLLIILESSYVNSGLLQALSTVFFVSGNYIFYLYVVGQEKKQKKYKIIK